MDRNDTDAPDLYDPTIRTTVDEARGTIENPGRLIELTDDGQRVFDLDHPLVLIGRDPAADIVVEGRMVADYHAEITYENGLYVLRHLEGRRKLTVGGKSIKEYILTDCDEIQLADRTFVFRAPATQPPPSE
ncbi:MAG: FHA domain-containing protein [Candidatus Krumholzibacteria bacterium]|nr:FHA domain-containing protein [Candidatus Krumholzibacteria bacterium]